MKARSVAGVLAAIMILTGCSASTAADAEEVASYFAGFHADYDPVGTGQELAERSDIVVLAELEAIHPGPVARHPEIESFEIVYVLIEFTVLEPLVPDGPAAGETLSILLQRSGELANTPVGNGRSIDVEATAVLYLSEYWGNPDLPFDDWELAEPLYVLYNPQSFVMEYTEDEVILALSRGIVVSGGLEDFYPTDEPLPRLD